MRATTRSGRRASAPVCAGGSLFTRRYVPLELYLCAFGNVRLQHSQSLIRETSNQRDPGQLRPAVATLWRFVGPLYSGGRATAVGFENEKPDRSADVRRSDGFADLPPRDP